MNSKKGGPRCRLSTINNILSRDTPITHVLRKSTHHLQITKREHICLSYLSKPMIDHSEPLLSTLPIELVYRIFDHLETNTIFYSVDSVCAKWNAIIDTYHPYQVKLICSLLTIRFDFYTPTRMLSTSQCTAVSTHRHALYFI